MPSYLPGTKQVDHLGVASVKGSSDGGGDGRLGPSVDEMYGKSGPARAKGKKTVKKKSVFIFLIFSLILSLPSLLLLYVRWLLQTVSLWFSEPKWKREEVFGAAFIPELTVQGKRPLFSKHLSWGPADTSPPVSHPLQTVQSQGKGAASGVRQGFDCAPVAHFLAV